MEVELQKQQLFKLFERGEMDKILEEQGFQHSGACDAENCQIEMGKLIGVDYIILGSVSKVASTYTLNVKKIKVETGEVVQSFAQDEKGGLDDILSHSCEDIARQMAGKESASRDTDWTTPLLWSGLGVAVIVVVTILLSQDEDGGTEPLQEEVIVGGTL